MTTHVDRRRETDNLVDKLGYKLDTIAVESQHTRENLEKHVSECAAMQKKVFGVVLFLTGWIVAHSPEAAAFLTKLAKAVP